MAEKLLLGPKDRPKTGRWIALSFQHVFAMFSATVLVPLQTGLPVSVALFSSGIGTLIYILCTKKKVPIYLGSSFAYIAYIQSASLSFGVGAALTGLLMVGLIYMLISIVITLIGSEWLDKLLPPVVVGPVIMVIGLGLSSVACGSAGLISSKDVVQDWRIIVVSLITMFIIAVVAIKAKGFLKVIPFLIGIVCGYVLAVILGFIPFKDYGSIIDFTSLVDVLKQPAKWFALPQFQILGWENQEIGAGISMVKINFAAAISVIPLAFVTMCEHIGDHKVLGQITGENYLKDPGLNRTLLGDGLATSVAALIGGPANTSYGENTSVVGMTRIGSVWVTGGAAVIAILLSFSNIFTTFIQTIPSAVMGGVCLILYGFIAANGLKTLINAKVDMKDTRNLIIVSVILVIGIGGATIKYGFVEFTSMALSAIVGILLNKLLPKSKQQPELQEN
ncbi:MAG: NCS2 family nucleobase:cation symporter [Erysipelotrichaceae bacterium]|nr:NCS2 family nucleobase:cation symporter [Erysipelotrichaceae bacterium]